MKRSLLGASFAIACAAAIAPVTAAGANAADQGGQSHAPSFLSASAHSSAVASAQSDAAALARAVGLSKDDALTVRTVLKDADGTEHVRVDRTFKGVKVVGGDMVIDRDASGKVVAHYGYDGAITVGLAPKITKTDAQTRGLAAAKAYKQHRKHRLDAAAVAGNTLVIAVDASGKQSLAYQTITTGTTEDRTPSRVHTLVDANSGATLQSYDQIDSIVDDVAKAHAAKGAAPRAKAAGNGHGLFTGDNQIATTQSGGSYQLKNPDNGNYTTDSKNQKIDGSVFTSSSNTWGDGTVQNRASAAADAEFGADKTFEFYKNVMNRNGIWDNGQGSRSRVHYDDNYTNAFWDGQQMTYGDGEGNTHPLTEIDVSAHEMSHGVTENSAGLVYEGDAGGLNEANSDIMGTAVEWYANLPSDTPDYLIGEQIDLNGDGTPLRYMDQPSKDGSSPDCWSSNVASLDPHMASGPLNHWYYLASEGSGSKTINGVKYNSPTCNSSTVTGAGHGDIEKIWYRTLSTKLTSESTYQDAREGAITSAIELYGASSKQCTAVESAFDAIDVPAGSASCGGGDSLAAPSAKK